MSGHLTDRQRLLALLRQQRGDPAVAPVERADRTAELPVSFGQHRLWVTERLTSGRPVYNAPVAYRLRGRLDVPALRAALHAVVSRHEALRTTFHTRDGVPVQVIGPSAALPLEVHSLAAKPIDEAEAEAAVLAGEEARRPFDLERGPLSRARLVELAENDHLLLVTMHHIVTDSWSLGVLFDELATGYSAACQGSPAALPELPVQYADFAAWQRKALSGDGAREHLAYWVRRLRGTPGIVTLPPDRPRPAVPSFGGAEHTFTVSPETTSRIRAIATEADATLFMVLLAAFSVQLGRYAGETDIVVGSPVSGRDRAELEPLIGFFVNTIVLRTDLSADPSFVDVVRQVRATALEAYEHQRLPFEKIVDELAPARQLSVHPLHQVGFHVYQREKQVREHGAGPVDLVSGHAFGLPGLHSEPFPTSTGTSKFDLAVTIVESGGTLTGGIEYATDLYDAATIERFAANFRVLLDGIAADPRRRVSRLPLLTDREHLRLVEEWNDTGHPVDHDRCLHQLVEDQARRTPEAVALVAGAERVTYRRLDERANALAHQLRELGVGPESIVGVCVERSVEAIVALLGTLKAGGAFVPLDPDQPGERLAYLIEDTGAAVVLTQRHLRAALPATTVPVRVLDADPPACSTVPPSVPPTVPVEPDNLAYAIYTSGSTGRPKCVLTPHVGIVNLMAWMQGEYRLTADDRLVQKAPFGFDVSVWEIFWTLSAGATLVVARPGGHREPAYLAELVRAERATVIHFVPAMLRAFIAEPEAARCTSLRMVICGGEAITPDLLARFHQTLPIDLHNQYGPTEASSQTAYWPLTPGSERIPLGRAVWNTRLYVLDAARQPAPQGATGELYIAGVELARGYHDQPAMTAARFLPDPFGEPGTRMYRSGDLVRWLPDGTLEYLGRTDHQVKIRGFRIEPGEIESRLKAHPAVRQAAVVAREDPVGDKQLIGYVVPAPGGTDGLADLLRQYLSEWLPAYMVPAALVVMPALPLNGNGKVDLAALPAPVPATTGAADAPPRTRAEQVLGEVWCAVLGLAEVGTGDNFFGLGGDSIRAIDVASRAATAGFAVTPSQLFQHQTLAELAAVATPAAGTATAAAEQGEATGEVDLTPVQREFFATGDPERHYLAQYVGLLAPAGVDAALLDTALDHLVGHHDVLRARFEHRAGAWTEVIDPHRPAPRLERVTADGGEDLDVLLDREAARVGATLSLSAGPLLRAVLVDRPGARPLLLLAVHHLCVDAVSWRVLTEDLESAYEQLASGSRNPRLPAKTASVQVWARRLRELAGSAELAAEARRWRDLLAGHTGPPPARADHRAGIGRVDTVLSRRTTRALLQDMRAAYLTRVDDVLLAAMALAHHRRTGATRLLVDVEGHGREPLFPDVDLSRTVGWFTAIHPVPLELTDPDDLESCLLAVKETVRAVPGRGIGFGLLRHLRTDEHGLGDVPAGEVLVNYLGRTDVAGHRDGARFEPLPEPLRLATAPDRPPTHPLEVVARLEGQRLAVRWLFDRAVHDEDEVTALAEGFSSALAELAALGGRPGGGARAASDFPLSGLSTQDIRELFGNARDIEDVYPLSATQEGLLFHTLSAPDDAMYVAQASWDLGDVDGAVMAEAWREVARRTPALRTRLLWDGVDRPLQVVERDCRLPVTLLDWTDRTPADQQAALDDLHHAGRTRGIDLRQAPLMRVTLVRTGPAGWRILLESHHIVLDGWSMVMVIGDVLAVYRAMVSGEELRLTPRRPFRDYIEWCEGRTSQADEEFWTAYLAGFTEPTPLPPGRPRAGHTGHALHELALPHRFGDALERRARSARVTANTITQAAWGLLLGHRADTTDVVFGATLSGRAGMPDMERMVGLFINTLPVRVRTDGDQPLDAWLRALQADRSRVPAEHLSLAEITRWSEVSGRRPLFATNVVFENYPVDEPVRAALGGLSSTALRVEESTHYPLGVVVTPGPPLEVQLQYDRSRFTPPDIEDLAARFGRVLVALVDAPGSTSLSDITASIRGGAS